MSSIKIDWQLSDPMLPHVITASFAQPIETKATTPVVSGISAPAQWLQDWGGLPAVAGPVVTPTSAMGVPAVKACVELIAGAIGALPVKVYKDGAGGGRTEATDHLAYALVHDDANDWTSAGQLRAQLVTDALLRGNGFGLIRRDQDGLPYEILRLQPEAVSIVLDRVTGEPWFRITTGSGHEMVAHGDMIHVPAPCTLDGITGIAPIVRSRDAISLAIALERHASRIFAKGARPSGIIDAPNLRFADSAEKLRANIAEQNSNENSGGVAVAYGGVKFTPLEFKTVDLQFAELRAFQIGEIAKAFSVPPTLVGELAKATLSNSETMGRQFLTMTLLPWIGTIRDAYRRTLIPRAERRTYAIDFVLDGLLQADSAARAAFYAAMRASGNMTANEVRARENLPRHEHGDRLESPHIASPGTTPTPALETSVV